MEKRERAPTIGVSLTANEKALIEEEARHEGRSVSNFVRFVVMRYVQSRRAERQPQPA